MNILTNRAHGSAFPRMVKFGAASLALLGLGAISPIAEAAEVFNSKAGVRFRLTEVAGNLANPWALAFLPGGDMLVTERPGRLRLIRAGKLERDAISGTPKVAARSQGGLLDVALHPKFAEN